MTKFISSLAQRDKSNLTYSVIYIVENHQNIATEQIIIKLIFLGTIGHQIHKKQTYKQNKSGVSSLAKKNLRVHCLSFLWDVQFLLSTLELLSDTKQYKLLENYPILMYIIQSLHNTLKNKHTLSENQQMLGQILSLAF